jgi:alpha-amylase
MKKLFTLLLFFVIVNNTMAKKVKFAVDLSQQIISPNGVHVTGDFQTIAGFSGGDWASNTTPLSQEGSSSIYSIVVDIPAFAKYEYKFVNGDQFYEAEFVPVESRVVYNFNDNRWIYVDSLANDTSFVGALLFAGNAPDGMFLLRTKVDMQYETVAAEGVHIAGNFQSWDPATTILYSFVPGIYEVISYVTAGTYGYKFVNGNSASGYEIIPGPCSVNSSREVAVATDVVLSTVCFSQCGACTISSLNGINPGEAIKLFPNPSATFSKVSFNDNATSHKIYISELSGRIIRTISTDALDEIILQKESLTAGVYLVDVYNPEGNHAVLKWIIE